jgi:hypothetical protein
MAKGIGLIIAALVCAPSAMAQQPAAPSMSTAWRSITLDQAGCVARAQTAMRAAGLTENYETVGESVYGEVPSYTGAIRCIAAKGIAYFVVAGPDVKLASQHQRNLVQQFEQGGGQPGAGQPGAGQPGAGQPGGVQPGGQGGNRSGERN